MTSTTSSTTIIIGQRIHCILYGGRDGIVYAIHGEQAPESVRSICGVISMGGRASFDVVFEDGTVSQGLPECIMRGVQWRLLGSVASAAEIAESLAHATTETARRKAESETTAKRRADERATLAADPANAHLLKPADKPTWSRGRIVAENIRRQLKLAFPGVKFSVKCDHNSVNIGWECGPTEKQVNSFVSRHQVGNFNGMEDIYESNPDATFADVFGGVDYVFCRRDYPDEALEIVYRQLADGYGVPYAGRDTRIGQEYVSNLAYRILTAWPLGTTLSGVERVESVMCGSAEEFWRAV